MTETSYLITAIVALASAITYLWGQMLINQKKTEGKQNERIELLDKEIKELREKIILLEKEKSAINAQFLAYASTHDSTPIPMWSKNLDGVVIACNRAYERTFLLPRGKTRGDYIGHKDEDVWPEEIAREFRQNDMKVLQREEVLDITEVVPSHQNPERKIRIIKWPRYSLGIDKPFGVSGLAILEPRTRE